ncbi:hypothetical protein BC834DRAFT_971662 [Gloeopeniophorella convolvens]|nr:hypothetical protein BC834DRAFT_971662 [Gloeopeniophorella convolvens]
MIAVRDINSDLATGLLVGYILALVPLAILYYDYLISLSDEVKYFWLWRTNEPNRDVSIRPLPGSLHKQRRLPWQRPDWISCLCLVNRYVSTIGHIPIMKSYLVMGDLAFFEMILQILVAVLCIVRTYSLYGEEHHMSMGLAKKPWNERTRHIFNFRRPVSGRRIVLVLLCSIVFISVLSGSVRPDDNRKGHTKGPGGISDLSGMQRPAFPSRGARRIVLAWGGALVLDTAVFFLTVLRAIQSRRDAGPGASIREMAFLQVMVRNGTLYFATLFLVNLANILMLLFAPPLLKDSVTTMTNVLSTTLISRVMLHTRAKHAKTCKERRRKMVMLASPELADWDNVRDDRQQRSQEDAFGIEYIDLQPIPRQN